MTGYYNNLKDWQKEVLDTYLAECGDYVFCDLTGYEQLKDRLDNLLCNYSFSEMIKDILGYETIKKYRTYKGLFGSKEFDYYFTWIRPEVETCLIAGYGKDYKNLIKDCED